MSILFIQYPTCSTCKKAKKWLEEHAVNFEDRNIKEQNPTSMELDVWITKSGLDIKKFFNTSGLVYKSMGLKDKLPDMTREDKINLLASDGMLVKRPIVVTEDTVLVGFKEDEWKSTLVR